MSVKSQRPHHDHLRGGIREEVGDWHSLSDGSSDRLNLEKALRSSRDFPDQLKRTVYAGATLDAIF